MRRNKEKKKEEDINEKIYEIEKKVILSQVEVLKHDMHTNKRPIPN